MSASKQPETASVSSDEQPGQQYLGIPPWRDRDSMRHYYVEEGLSVETIATEVCDDQLDEPELRHVLSGMDLLDPWDDPAWLADAYREHSAPQIAYDLLDGAVSDETIRQRLHAFGLMDDPESRGSAPNTVPGREKLLAMDPNDWGDPIPEGVRGADEMDFGNDETAEPDPRENDELGRFSGVPRGGRRE